MKLIPRLRHGLRAGLEAALEPDPASAREPAIDYARVEEIVRASAEEIWKRRYDLSHAIQDVALRDSARFVIEHIPLHLGKSHYELRRDAVLAAPEGMFMEFGVWTGNWLRQMAAVRDVRFYGFDSFEGLPEPWWLYPTGEFDLKGELPQMPANVELVKGWFHESLPPFLERHPGPVAFLHIDCDLYSATKTVLDLIGPRLQPGSQIVLDDFMYMPGWQAAEHRAFFEFLGAAGWSFEYTGYASEFPACAASVRLLERA